MVEAGEAVQSAMILMVGIIVEHIIISHFLYLFACNEMVMECV